VIPVVLVEDLSKHEPTSGHEQRYLISIRAEDAGVGNIAYAAFGPASTDSLIYVEAIQLAVAAVAQVFIKKLFNPSGFTGALNGFGVGRNPGLLGGGFAPGQISYNTKTTAVLPTIASHTKVFLGGGLPMLECNIGLDTSEFLELSQGIQAAQDYYALIRVVSKAR